MDEEASIPTRAFPGAILPDALAANPRALTRLRAGGASQSGPSARVSFALALDTLEGPIREALEALAELVGASDPEAVYERVFSRFCVGK